RSRPSAATRRAASSSARTPRATSSSCSASTTRRRYGSSSPATPTPRCPHEDGALVKADVAVVGAGTAGLVAASMLANEGKKVVLVERERTLGGRSRHWRHHGHEIGLGSHLVEDPGDSLTRVCDQLGVTLEHS